jgi:hypothetical protein
MVLGSIFINGSSLEQIGHVEESNRVIELIEGDRDVLVTGVPGSGRYALMQRATKDAGAILLGIDCIRATNSVNLVNLLLDSTFNAFPDSHEFLRSHLLSNPDGEELLFMYEDNFAPKIKLASKASDCLRWKALKVILELIGRLAVEKRLKVVVVLKQISHIRSWDRKLKWENFLRLEIYKHPQVSYAILETVAELEEMKKNEDVCDLYKKSPVDIVKLSPLPDAIITSWFRKSLSDIKLAPSIDGSALRKFLCSVDGHISTAEALLRQIEMICGPDKLVVDEMSIQKGLEALLSDLSAAFESFLLMLPASQLQLIECLALEPTPKPHSKKYIQKYNLARGGTLQGALEGLQKKGLIYGFENDFRLTLPLFAVWIQKALQDSSPRYDSVMS